MDAFRNSQEILVSEKTTSYNAELSQTFADFIKEHRKAFDQGNGISTRNLADNLGISYEMFRKIINMNKPTKNRDCIIGICALLEINSDEADIALQLYNEMPLLDVNNKRDDVLIDILENQSIKHLDLDQINNKLIKEGFNELDIIDHRTTIYHGRCGERLSYKMLKKRTQTYSERLMLGDAYDSLDTEYSTDRYRCIAEMWLDDEQGGKTYHLSFVHKQGGTLEIHGDKEYNITTFKSIEDAGELKEYYQELESMTKREVKQLLAILNDTRNYRTRIGAGILNDTLHVYAETFNYRVPELNEYYLFEYKNGMPLFSIFRNSEFMRCYLQPEEYYSLYGKNNNILIGQFSKLYDIISEGENQGVDDVILQYRYGVFKELKEQADQLVIDLRNRNRFIRNLDYIFDDRDRVCEFYGVENEFKCIMDTESEMMSAGIDTYTFEVYDNVEITLDDLYKAFEFGFNSIEEICRAKKKHGKIENII